MAMIHLTQAIFEKEVVKTDGAGGMTFIGKRPAIIDCFATWCGPCKAFSPIFEKLAEEYAGKIDFYKLDVDEEEQIASIFQIRSIPTLLYFHLDGSVTGHTGAMPENAFREELERFLASEANQ